MTRGSKLTNEERIAAVQEYQDGKGSYRAKGVEGLTDRRGKAKPEDELTEADRLRMENKILQAKLKDMEMENKLLKKLKELEGGDR